MADHVRPRRPRRAAPTNGAGPGASTVPVTEEPARTLAALVHGRLRADVVGGRLRPGDRLRFDVLRRSYGVGLSPLREALSRLAAEGLVSLQGQKGFQVASVSLADLRDVYDVRRSLEVTALRASIARGDDRWEGDIVAAFHRLAKTYLRSPDHPALLDGEWERAHHAFHLSLLSACRSPWLLHLRNILFDHSERYRQLAIADGYPSRVALREHRAVMEAALARDADRACRLLEAHMRRAADKAARGVEAFQALRPAAARRGRLS